MNRWSTERLFSSTSVRSTHVFYGTSSRDEDAAGSRSRHLTDHCSLITGAANQLHLQGSKIKNNNRSIATAKWGDSATILQWEQPAYMFITKVIFQKGLLLWSTVVTSNIPNTNVLIWGTFKHKYEEHDYRKRYKPITPRSTIEEPKYAHTHTHTVWLNVSNK